MSTILSADTEVKKHVAAIHIQNDFSLLQRKMTNVLLANAYNELRSQDEFDIPVQLLSDLCAFNSKNTAYLKDNLASLASTPITWNLLAENFDGSENNDELIWTVSPMFDHITLKGGVCYYAYNQRVKKHLADPTVFAKFSLAIQRLFASNYGLALYENCIRYKNIGRTKWFPLDVFRELMGVSPGEYKEFKALNRRVIKKAVDEVNTLSDIEVEANFNRVGRCVEEIQFTVRPNAQRKLDLLQQNKNIKEKNVLFDEMIAVGISQSDARDFLDKLEPALIQANLEYAKKEYASGKIKKTLAGFAFAAIKNGYVDETFQVSKSSTKTKKPTSADDDYQRSIELKREETRRAADDKQKRALIEAFLENLNDEDSNKILLDYEESIQDNQIALDAYSRKGLGSSIVKMDFLQFVAKNYF